MLASRTTADVPTGLIALVNLKALVRWKLDEPIPIAVSGHAGRALWPLRHGTG